jgi:5-methylcytosine-specific restriction protein B
MADFFTSDHFRYLIQFKDQKRDSSNSEQNYAYKELIEAYALTDLWAKTVQKRLFPSGYVKVRRRPTNQGNYFPGYTWAKIYPNMNSSEKVAYTVGLDANNGYIVKIDTVGINDNDGIRKEYLKLRGNINNSPFVAIQSAAEGILKKMDDLVDWTVEAIEHFEMSYEDVVGKLNLSSMLSNDEILSHFMGHKDFIERQRFWGGEVTKIFCDLARATHEKGIDWWFTKSTNSQLRFGRKELSSKGNPVCWIFLSSNSPPEFTLKKINNEKTDITREPLSKTLGGEIKEKMVGFLNLLEEETSSLTPRVGHWPDEYGNDLEESDMSTEDTSLTSNNSNVPKSRVLCENIIYFGPPGTGKTYRIQKLLASRYQSDLSKLTDDEWKNNFISQNILNLTWWEVIAAALCDLGGKAKVSQIETHPFIKALAISKGRNQNITQTIWGALQLHAIDDSKTVKAKQRISPAIFDKSDNSIWGFAGVWSDIGADLVELVSKFNKGKSAGEVSKRYCFVTFHQSYGYEDFIEGLRPVLNSELEVGQVQYEIRPGVFKDLCVKARASPTQKFAIVIDEINRGNISKIFGELITLIEVDKRENSLNPATITLPYSGDLFSVPSNIDIIGTMNTADRSLALVDTALRRRFEFIEMMPDPEELEELVIKRDGVNINVKNLLIIINKRIEALYDRDHTIGHAYFMHIKKIDEALQFEELKATFKNRIIPLLEEYFFEDWQKIRLVLGDNQKKNKQFQFVHELELEEDVSALFGDIDDELNQYSIRSRFQLNNAALDLPSAYEGIYALNASK